jgi:hypothetical protein
MNQIANSEKQNNKAQWAVFTSSEKESSSDKSSHELPAYSEEVGSGSTCGCCCWEELSRACKYEEKQNYKYNYDIGNQNWKNM